MDVILKVEDLGISFGNNHVLKSVNYELFKNEVLGVIGPNGAGKTVMLNILTGILRPTKGRITLDGQDITHKKITERSRLGLGRTFQIPRSFEKMTVFENVIVGGVYGGLLGEKAAKKKSGRNTRHDRPEPQKEMVRGQVEPDRPEAARNRPGPGH